MNSEDVKHIAALAKLGLDGSEIENFREQLSNILDNFEILKQVSTENVEPTAQSIWLTNVLREDEVEGSLTVHEVLANAPSKEEQCFRIRAVIEES